MLVSWLARGEILHFVLEGEYDFSEVHLLEGAFETAFKNPHSVLLIHTEPVEFKDGNFQICSSGCAFVDGATLKVLASNFAKAKQEGREVWVILTPRLKRLFDIVNLTRWCDKVEVVEVNEN